MGILSNTDSVRSRIERGLHQRGFEYKYGHYYYGDYRFQMRDMSVAFGVKIKGGRGYHKKGWWYYGKINVENLLELADKVVERVKANRAKAVAERPATQGVGVEVKENEDKDGVEIQFAEKPDQSVIDQVKAHGFRWSKFQKLWYARRSPEALEFAYGLVGKQPENLDGPDMGRVLDEPTSEPGTHEEDEDEGGDQQQTPEYSQAVPA